MNEGIFDKDVFGRKLGEYEDIEEGGPRPEDEGNYVRDRKKEKKEMAPFDLFSAIRACRRSGFWGRRC